VAIPDHPPTRRSESLSRPRARSRAFAIDAKATRCDPSRPNSAALRWRSHPTDACYVRWPTSSPATASDCSPRPRARPVKESDALEALRPLLESSGVLKIGFNIKFNAVCWRRPASRCAIATTRNWMSYALDAAATAHGLDAAGRKLARHANAHPRRIDRPAARTSSPSIQVAIDRAAAYSAEDADVILRLWRVLKPRLVAEHMTAVYETLERPLVTVLARMGARGISIDRQVLSRLSGDFAQTAARVEAELQELAGEPSCRQSQANWRHSLCRWASPAAPRPRPGVVDVGTILDDLAGRATTCQEDPGVAQVSKLKSTYTDALRVTSIRRPTASTPPTHGCDHHGRCSSNEPNLQNIPVRTEDGRRLAAPSSQSGPQIGLCGLFANRAATLGRNRRHSRLKQAFRDGLDIQPH